MTVDEEEQSQFQPTQILNGSQDSDNELLDEATPWGSLEHTSDSSLYPISYEFVEDSYLFGRGKKSSIVLPDASVSSSHLKVYREGSTAKVIDVGSSNGTWVNNKKLVKNVPLVLKNDDVIALVKQNPQLLNEENAKGKTVVENWYEMKFKRMMPSDDSRPLCSEMEAKYKVFEELGKGTYATVYRLVNIISQEEFAVKIIEKRQFLLNNPSVWEEQINEANILSKLQHPGIISLQDIYKTDEAIFLVLELVRGGELFNRLVDNGAYTEEKAKKLLVNILEAVVYLHDQDIVHRDLKPENILLSSTSSDVEIKLADFGVAKEEKGGRATVCGSMSYIAPEVLDRKDSIKGAGRYGKTADIWSLGVITYVVLTCTPPFAENDTRPIKIKMEELHLKREWKNLSVLTQDFVSSLLTVDAKNRYTARQALNHSWLKQAKNLPDMPGAAVYNSKKRKQEMITENSLNKKFRTNVRIEH